MTREELLDEIDEELSYLSNNELKEVLQAIFKIQRSSRY
jgi:nucleoid DNA-binding protein